MDAPGTAARPQATHELKLWPEFYVLKKKGGKPFEVRRDDREPRFEEGDTLLQRVWDPATKTYTGEEVSERVTCVLRGFSGIEPGFCVMGTAAPMFGWDQTYKGKS